ncbi:hypothetical protein XELAEV_18011540mg [Xenopus laevis]|uniref:CCHC-type domain-containing protein n=1 Tax=Xenopus laevis TaxID=8355 RepID=A0A974DKZ1_XENLA|nr:hypothetical protein XELAEV_18011540mg [Xenopus laevis]
MANASELTLALGASAHSEFAPMSLIKPWEDFYTNWPQCKEMEAPRELPCETVQENMQCTKDFLPVIEQQNPDPVQNAMDITHTDSVTGEKVVSEDEGGQQVECVSAVTGGTSDNRGDTCTEWLGVDTHDSTGTQERAPEPVKPNIWERRRLFARQTQRNEDFEGQVFKRRNVARIKWERENDIFAFISVSEVEFDISFKLSQGLERFWELYELKEGSLEPETKAATILFKNESIPPNYVLVWLQRRGSKRHMASNCDNKVCALCGARGHVSKECNTIHCNLCSSLDHTHHQCPDAWHNIVKACFGMVRELFGREEVIEQEVRMEAAEEGRPEGNVMEAAEGRVERIDGESEAGSSGRQGGGSPVQ